MSMCIKEIKKCYCMACVMNRVVLNATEYLKQKEEKVAPSEPSTIPVVDYEKEAEELYPLHYCDPENDYINDERRAERKAHIRASEKKEITGYFAVPIDERYPDLKDNKCINVPVIYVPKGIIFMKYFDKGGFYLKDTKDYHWLELRTIKTHSDTNCKVKKLIEWIDKESLKYYGKQWSQWMIIREKANSLIQQ